MSHYTSFPDPGRANGHLYDSVLYTPTEHYSDSSVLIVTPQHLKAASSVDLIFWFHGWRNNIDTAIVEYGLARQFAESKVNAVMVLAETAKDAPDSYGGKLEHANTFAMLVKDVLNKLMEEHIIRRKCKPGHILLAGHSGAYRVMAGILDNGNMPVNEVILFDALYANTQSFINWIATDSTHRFIDLYTDHGGTLQETKNLMMQLQALHFSIDSTEESSLTIDEVRKDRLLFIHTAHEHNFIIQHPDNFELYLENSPFLKRIE